MRQLRAMLYATLSDEAEPIVEHFRAEAPDEDAETAARRLADWLRFQAAEVEKGLSDDT